MVDNQFFNFAEFINSIEILVVMVAHNEIKNRINELEDILILDTKNISSRKNTYKL